MDLTENYFDTGEVRLHYMEGPRSGPPLVLLHGATSNWQSWMTVLPKLTESWHVFAVDQRGHGKSGWGNGPGSYHLSNFAADALAFLRGCVQAPAVVYGHSWGAVVTLLCGSVAQDWVTALVMEDPPIMVRRENKESKPYHEFFAWALQIKQQAGSLAELRALMEAANPRTPPVVMDSWSETIYHLDPAFLTAVLGGPTVAQGIDFAQAARSIRCPALLMQADPALGAALVDKDLRFLLRHNPKIQVARFPGASHGINFDQTEKLLAVVSGFLAA